jgi:hypothetical protein
MLGECVDDPEEILTAIACDADEHTAALEFALNQLDIGVK